MRAVTAVVALLLVLCGSAGQRALADVVIPYNEYSSSPTIGRGNGTSTDPNQPGYGAMRISSVRGCAAPFHARAEEACR